VKVAVDEQERGRNSRQKPHADGHLARTVTGGLRPGSLTRAGLSGLHHTVSGAYLLRESCPRHTNETDTTGPHSMPIITSCLSCCRI
jgi:hypothetical protein